MGAGIASLHGVLGGLSFIEGQMFHAGEAIPAPMNFTQIIV